jgi:signal peptidase II
VATLGKKGKVLLKTGLAFILGGAYSNTYDRLRRKYVVDYISFDLKSGNKLADKFKKIVFNISDFAIIIGSMFLVINEMLAD